MKPFFEIFENMSRPITTEVFKLHMHNKYEILVFLDGDAKYVIEENIYDLKPYDIMVIRKNQMHRIMHNSLEKYHRIGLYVYPEFFKANGCEEYEELFLNPLSEIGNKIDAQIVKSSGIYDAFARMRRYSNQFELTDSPVLRAGVTEILYLINNIKLYSKPETKNTQLKEVISYINKNYTKEMSLDDLEKMFFISKYHLCHIFRTSTGMTVHQYITNKRLALANDLIKQGTSISVAAMSSGFKSYSSFYRAYLDEYGTSPKSK